MNSRNLKVASAIAVVLAGVGAIAAVLFTSAAQARQYNRFNQWPCPTQQVICPIADSLPGSYYPVYLHAGTVAAVISIALTGMLFLLVLVRRLPALFLIAGSLSSTVTSVTLMRDGDYIDRSSQVWLAILIVAAAVFIAAIGFHATGMATKRTSGPVVLLATLVAIGATMPLLLAKVLVGV